MPYMVREVADLAGISVRTLHYYDGIGLLKPEIISSAGYRLYTDHDLERLHLILFFKELDFSLKETRNIIAGPSFDRKKALTSHKELLIEKKKRLERIIEAVDKTIHSVEGGMEMSKKEIFKVFDMAEIEKHKAKYAEEVRQKYGNTDAYRESEKKTSKYSKDDWTRITADSDRIHNKLAAMMEKGPEDQRVQAAIGEWRQHITDNFYNCTPEIFRGLGDLYAADERFTANIDKFKPGLAAFMREAMHIYCDNFKIT